MDRSSRVESFGQKLRAFGLSLALHILGIVALLVGVWWQHETRPVSMPGPVIEATLVGPTAAPKSHSSATKRNVPKPAPAPPKTQPESPKPEPAKPEPAKPEPAKETPAEVQRQDQIEREKVAAIAEQKAEQEKKEQDEKHHQEQVLLEQEQKDKQAREVQQKQLADIRKQRDAADRNVKLQKEKLAQLEDLNKQKADQQAPQPAAEHEAPQAQTGAGGKDNDLMARYSAAIQAAVTQNWNRPDSADAGLRCTLNITQIPGGDVIGVAIGSPCNADQATRNSIEQAVMKAAPLPYQGYEKVFQRTINFNFKYNGEDG